MSQINQNQKSVALLIILFAFIATNAMTIPLVKGNTWSYSYRIDTNASPYVYSASDTGLLRFSVDSVKVIADTTLFTLSYFDSGSFQMVSRTDTIRPYVLKYQKSYRLSGDLIIESDTISSPGCNGSLLFFTKQSDLSYSWGAPNDGGGYKRKTDSFPVNVIKFPTTLFYTKIDSSIYLIFNQDIFSSSNKDSVFSWVPEIGMISFYSNKSYYNNPNDQSGKSYTYSLISFNNSPIPPLSQLSAKSTKPFQAIHNPNDLNHTIVMLSGRNIKNGYLTPKEKGYFSLRGQKMAFSARSQLIICR